MVEEDFVNFRNWRKECSNNSLEGWTRLFNQASPAYGTALCSQYPCTRKHHLRKMFWPATDLELWTQQEFSFAFSEQYN